MNRILEFNVKSQIINKDETCDFENIVSGTKNYLIAEFHFNEDWEGFKKVAVFKRTMNEFPAIIENGRCIIPEDALTWKEFGVYVVGQKDDVKVKTNEIKIEQVVN